MSLKALVKERCEYKDVRDFKGRTPLHLAAELGQFMSRFFPSCFTVIPRLVHSVKTRMNACLFDFPADRSETAKFLLELSDPAPAGVEDDQGQAAIVWMIAKMPPVVSSTSTA